MSAHDPNLGRKGTPILRWLGLRPDPQQAAPETTPASEPGSPAPEPRERRRRQLIADVGSFLLAHRLEVNAYSLAIAHDVITGSDQRLARAIEDRVAARQPVTLEWLEQAGHARRPTDSHAALKAMMATFEQSLLTFSQTTRTARSAASEAHIALEAQVDELEHTPVAGAVVSRLAALARTMVERTRELEQEMQRSELHTRSLQRNLADARRLADLDHLTGLPNRRAFEDTMEREVAAARENGEPLCVAFIDVDHFKKVNDIHGHEAGDRVLKAVAQTLARISDDTCHVARHGGEEFVILLRGRSLDQACTLLDTTREAMAERRLVNRATDVPFGRITFSGGVADIFAHANPRDALKAADEALYAAKTGGRNRILRHEQQGDQATD